MPTDTLPSWAARAEHQIEGKLERIDVDAAALYTAWLAEFAANPPRPADFPGRPIGGASTLIAGSGLGETTVPAGKETRRVVPPMSLAEAVCDPDSPTQYWLECAYQCMKLELQVALRRFDFEIRVHDADKVFALAKWPVGRGVLAATRGHEARAHFKRLRGVLPG